MRGEREVMVLAVFGGKAVEREGGGIGGVWGEPKASDPVFFLANDAKHFVERRGVTDGGFDIDKLEKPPGAQGRWGHALEERGEGFDVENGGASRFGKELKTLGD